MLGGLDPIIIFQFSKLTDTEKTSLSKVPVVSNIVNKIGLPPIPIYLSEKLTGLFIESEDKNIDINTEPETKTDGTDPDINQKAINTTVRVNLKATRNSIGLTLLSACADLIVPKVTSREYAITYISGATTIFGGLLHSFSVNQNTENDLVLISIELTKTKNNTKEKKGPPDVTPIESPVQLDTGVNAPPPMAPLSPPLQGPPPQPPSAAPVQLNSKG